MRSRVISTNCPGHTKKIGESSGEWKLRPLLSSSLIYPLLSFESFVFFCQIKTAVVLFCMIPIAKLAKNSSTHTTMTGGFPNRPVERATRVLSFLIMAAERTTIVASKPGRPESWPLGLRTAARPTTKGSQKCGCKIKPRIRENCFESLQLPTIWFSMWPHIDCMLIMLMESWLIMMIQLPAAQCCPLWANSDTFLATPCWLVVDIRWQLFKRLSDIPSVVPFLPPAPPYFFPLRKPRNLEAAFSSMQYENHFHVSKQHGYPGDRRSYAPLLPRWKSLIEVLHWDGEERLEMLSPWNISRRPWWNTTSFKTERTKNAPMHLWMHVACPEGTKMHCCLRFAFCMYKSS